MDKEARHWRAKVAVGSRERDPKVDEYRARLIEAKAAAADASAVSAAVAVAPRMTNEQRERILRAVAETVAEAPPLSAEVRDRLRVLLRDTPTSTIVRGSLGDMVRDRSVA